MAPTVTCDLLQTRIERPNRTVPFRLPGESSLLRQAGYQKPTSGALLAGLISVIRSLFIDEEGCAWKDQLRLCEYSEWVIERQARLSLEMPPALVLTAAVERGPSTPLHFHLREWLRMPLIARIERALF